MGIDHVVDLGCAPKGELGGPAELVARVKARSRADVVVRVARDRGDARPEAAITFKVALMSPKGVEEREVSVAQLRAEAAPLDAVADACRGCPCADGGPFGCYRSIPYPVSASAEHWLLARLPPDPVSAAGQFLRRGVVDMGWDGSHGEKLRRQGRTFFESPQPEVARFADGFALDADQVHQMLFGVGDVGPSHALMLSLIFGVLPHDIAPAELRDPGALAARLRPEVLPREADAGIEAMAGFLRACAAAARLDVALLVDG